MEAAKAITFEKAARTYYEAYQSKWSVRHREAFLNTLKQYAFPVIGGLPVAAIDTGLVLRVLSRSGSTGMSPPARIRARIEKVLGWSTVRGFREATIRRDGGDI